MRTRMLQAMFAIVGLTLLSVLLLGQQQLQLPGNAPTAEAKLPFQQHVFVFVQRTDRHAKYRKPEMFDDVLNELPRREESRDCRG
jgi:hypothetical protein